MSQQIDKKGSASTMAVNGKQAPELREHDVVCEKGRGDHERWPGNKLYRSLINKYKDSYNDLTPVERSGIIGAISNTIKAKDGWFVQREEKSAKWCELTEEKVRKKVSDDLRREVRRRREKRSSNTMFSAKLKALKETEESSERCGDILQPVNDPRPSDVLFGPGARRHPGNKTYWRLMKMNLDHYIISPYGARSMISRSIVQGIRDQNGRFLEQDPKTAIWYEISDKRAIEKTSHALSNKKYKTRKRHPEEHGQHPFKGFHEFEDESSECSSEKGSIPSQDSEDSHSSRARFMSKKFRLMQRMDGPEFDDDDKESIPHAANILVMGFPRHRNSALAKKLGTPSSPPMSSKPATEERVLVSPNDSRSSVSEESRDEHPENERRCQPPSKRLPPVPEARPEIQEYSYRKSPMGPRLGHYEAYYEEERYHPDGIMYKGVPPISRVHGEYVPIRRYVERGPPPSPIEAGYTSPRASSALHSPSYRVSGSHHHPSPERHVLKAMGPPPPSGYWVREWGSPSARRGEQYWR